MSGVQSVERAFRLLQAISVEPSGLTELARSVELPISTASRLLGTLEGLGAVERLEDAGLYRIGPAISSMALTVDADVSLAAVAHAELEALMGEVHEAAGLSVASGFSMHYIDQVDSVQPIQVQDWVGSRVPMHLVSSGLVVLAHWPSEVLEQYLDGELAAPTKHSISKPEAIRVRLDDVRARGVAWSMEELEIGINSVAAPIFSGMGEVIGAVHLHGPAYRFPGDGGERYEAAVVNAGRDITALLGPTAVSGP